MLRELDGSAEGTQAIAERQKRLDAAEAQRQHALDVLSAERRAAELAYSAGVRALEELGEPTPSKAFMGSTQGKALADRASVVQRALEAAGQPGREPPAPVEKLLKSRSWPRSEAHRAVLRKAREIEHVLGCSQAAALRQAREALPELVTEALAAPLADPLASAEIQKALGGSSHATGSWEELSHRAWVLATRASLRDAPRSEVRKRAEGATPAQIAEAVSGLPPERRAELLAELGPEVSAHVRQH